MEKFAVDLDRVLDEFEFNEDCAEQVALSLDSENLWTKPRIKPTTERSSNYAQIAAGSNIASIRENENSLTRDDSENASRADEVSDTKNLATKRENTDSINDFHKQDRNADEKIQEKRYANFGECDTVSLTIRNDISEKLLQKRQNDSATPGTKNHNSYDKKFNQPNIKPSVSNVFSSLNDYINAPSGNIERQNQSVASEEGTCVKVQSQITKVVIGNDFNQIGIFSAGGSTDTEIPTCTATKYQNVVLPGKVDFNVSSIDMSESGKIQNPVKNMNEEDTAEEGPGKSFESEIIGKSAHWASLHSALEMEMPSVSTEIHNSRESLVSTVEKESKAVGEAIRVPAGGQDACDMLSTATSDTVEAGKPLESKESRHIYENVVSEVSTESDDARASRRHIYAGEAGDSSKAALTSCEVASRSQNQTADVTTSERQPVVGFNTTIDDLSEDELKRYLDELEAEDRAIEIKAAQGIGESKHDSPRDDGILRRVLATSRKRHTTDDEDVDEAPIFETVTIGVLPTVSEKQLQEKAKKFPVIDYTEQRESSSDNDAKCRDVSGNTREPRLSKETRGETENRNTMSENEINMNTVERQTSTETVENIGSRVTDANSIGDVNYTVESDENAPLNFNIHNVPANRSTNDSVTTAIESGGNNVEDVNVERDGKEATVEEGVAQFGKSDIHSQVSKKDRATAEVERSDDFARQNMTPETTTDGDNSNDDDGLSALPTSLGNIYADSAESSGNGRSETEDKLSRPQTLDIVSTVSVVENATTGGHELLEVDSDVPQQRDYSQVAPHQCSFEPNTILGKQPPFWIPDNEAPNCMLCDAKFTVIKRRHHCRACGKVLCSKCCNMRYRLQYQVNIDSRVCSPCYQLLVKVEREDGGGDCPPICPSSSPTDIDSSQARQPNPNNPMEYCSTIPPLQQLAGGLPTPPTVMVPVGVLKREGSTKQRCEGQKSVMFSDGIRPGCDLTELDTSWDLKPPYRKMGKRIPGQISTAGAMKRQNMPAIDPTTNCYIPQDPDILPPTVTIHRGEISYHETIDTASLYQSLRNECEPPIMFAINRNLYAYVKITNLNCCVNRICWNVTSRGLACVGQDEIILLVETLPDETQIPKDLFIHINQVYNEAIKGNTITELGVSIHQGGQFLGSREHAGFLFIRQTFQCLQKIILPPAPFLVGLLVHRWETPWAKVFPLRLMLRLGAEYRYYPCPLVSVRFRDAVYFEIGHTIMKVLADFRNYAYTLAGVRGLAIHMQDRTTEVLFPKNRYDQVIKGLNNSNDHVLAFAANFSIQADSHLVCIQTNTGDESSYQTQAINIHNKPRKVTGASFVVINGALKSSMGLSAKSSIVEDGLMVQIMPEKMEALKASLKNMQDFSIGCGLQGAQEPDETVNIKWVDNDVQFNLGVKSPIDGKPMDGIPSIRVHNGTDYMGTNRFIRWTEVFIMKSDDHPAGVHDPVDINKLSESIARATCAAFVKLLDLLATAGLTKLAVRATIHPDNVGYEAGSEGTRLPPIYMNSLDNELIQVLHKAAQMNQDTNTILELIFHVLDD